MFYAVIDDNKICYAIISSNDQLIYDSHIEMLKFNESVIGKKYINGVFCDVDTINKKPASRAKK